MKILHVANFSLWKFGKQFYAMDRKLSLGFAELGCFVYDFSYRDVARHLSVVGSKAMGARAMNRALLDTARALSPDLLLLGHSELVAPETLAVFRREHPGARVAMWFVDTLIPRHVAHIATKMPYLDAFLATVAGEPLRQLRESGRARLSYLPNLCHVGIECGRAFELEEPAYDFTFVGSATPGRESLLGEVRRRLPGLRTAFKGMTEQERVQGTDYIDLLSQSAMALNFSRDNETLLYSSDRLIQLLGNGCLVLTPPIPGLEDLFSNDELVRFGSVDELCERLAYYQHNPAARRRVARAGHARAHGDFSARRGAAYILDLLEDRDLSGYCWEKYRY